MMFHRKINSHSQNDSYDFDTFDTLETDEPVAQNLDVGYSCFHRGDVQNVGRLTKQERIAHSGRRNMAKGRILVGEVDFDISNMLRIYFSGQGYDVQVAPRGGDALDLTRKQLPQLIVLDIMLPDIDGYSVCRELRQTTRTSHIPIIFLTQKDERSDKIAGLELGADDYITKPFDIEELKLRVTNAISRQERESQTDPRTGLPSGRLIEDHLRRIIRTQGWALLDCRLMHFERFKDVYGFITGDEVLRFTSLLLGEVVDEAGTANDFIGHPGGDNFVVITTAAAGPRIRDRLKARFNGEVA